VTTQEMIAQLKVNSDDNGDILFFAVSYIRDCCKDYGTQGHTASKLLDIIKELIS